MFAIPVTEETLDLLEALNDGVRPEVEADPTFFIFRGMDAHNDIIAADQMSETVAHINVWKRIEILYL